MPPYLYGPSPSARSDAYKAALLKDMKVSSDALVVVKDAAVKSLAHSNEPVHKEKCTATSLVSNLC